MASRQGRPSRRNVARATDDAGRRRSTPVQRTNPQRRIRPVRRVEEVCPRLEPIPPGWPVRLHRPGPGRRGRPTGRAGKWMCSCRPSRNDPIRFHALGPQRIFSTIATLVNAPSRVIAILFLPSKKTVRSMSTGTGSPNRRIAARGDTWPNLPRAAQTDQNGIAPLAPLGSSAFALLLCWLSPP